jgi:hypothetical protein
MIFFIDWLEHALFGDSQFKEEGQLYIEMYCERLRFYAVRRAYRKYRGWFRRAELKLGLPTIVVAFNICEWPESEFELRCLHPDVPDTVALTHGEEPFPWKQATPLRNKEDAESIHKFLVDLENTITSQPDRFDKPLTPQELLFMNKVWYVLKDLPCHSSAVT